MSDADRISAARANRALGRAERRLDELDAAQRGDPSDVVISRPEIDGARGALHSLLDKLRDWRGECARCGRELRVELPPAPVVPALHAQSHNPTPPVRAASVKRSRAQFERAREIADISMQHGNHRAAARATTDMVEAAENTARRELALAKSTPPDAKRITRTDLESTRRAMRERVAALASDLERTGGLCCATCARDARIAIARGDA